MSWGTVELEAEVRNWLEGLVARHFATAAFYVDLLAEQGPLLGEPYTRQLDGKLREVRFHLDGEAVRVTYWIAPRRRIVLLTVFRKTVCGRRGRSSEHGGPSGAVSRKCTPWTSTSGVEGMAERSDWQQLRSRRMAEPGAAEAYEAARLAFELGKATREMREQNNWTQAQLAEAAGMTQPAVARFEAGGTVPTIPVLERLANALGTELVVRFTPRTSAA